MIKSPEETDFPPREEGNSSEGKAITANKASSSSTPWLRLKDPRIVRVSRALGGKDRHSKVCTIRGLRDRRVRLSVPTAIQLYDLQDRLGLNQPSKVVDWLLNAAKHEIDELPPLLVPPGSFGLNHHQALSTPRQATASASQSNKEGFKSNESTNFWDTTSDSVWRARSKEIVRENEKENWRQRNLNEEDDRQGNDHNNGDQAGQVSPNNNVPPRTNINHTFFPPSMVHNSPLGYRWESQNYPLSHLGSHGFTSQAPHHHHLHNLNNAVSLPSTLSLSTGSTQFLVSPPGTTTQTYFPNSQGTSSMEIDPRQVNHFQMLSTSSNSQNPILPNSLYANNQTVRFPFHFSTTTSASKLVQYSQNNSGSQQNKERE